MDELQLLRDARLHDALPCRPFTMSDQATMNAQPFPPGMSRLERLPDELKLRVGLFLTAPPAAKIPRKRYRPGYPGSIRNILPDLLNLAQQEAADNIELFGNGHRHNDTVLALASTSNRLCNVFLVEHSKKYGLQNTLFRSIELGNVNLVQRAVEYGADINKAGTKAPWRMRITPLQLAVLSEQLPVILYLLRRGVDKADELVMDILRDRDSDRRRHEEGYFLMWDSVSMKAANLKNHCRCKLLRSLMDATLDSSQTCHMSHTKPRLPRETLEALVPNGRHLWFILRTCMRRGWACGWTCDCGDQDGGDCPMRLISLLRQHGANWMQCGPFDDTPQGNTSVSYFHNDDAEWEWMYGQRYIGPVRGCGLADLRRFDKPFPHDDEYIFSKPWVAGAMHGTLLKNTAYRRDHCIPFLVAMLEHGVTAEQGDLSYAMDLASTPDTKQLSIAIVVALLRAGTNPNDPGAMKTAMRLACMEDTKDAAVAFVTLLLEHGADPSAEELRDEIQGAAEKWWVQSTWQSSAVFSRILRLLVEGGLDELVGREILAVLGLDRGISAEGGGGRSTKV